MDGWKGNGFLGYAFVVVISLPLSFFNNDRHLAKRMDLFLLPPHPPVLCRFLSVVDGGVVSMLSVSGSPRLCF